MHIDIDVMKKGIFICIALLISVAGLAQQQVTRFTHTGQTENRFYRVIGESGGKIYSLSDKNTLWSYDHAVFDSLMTDPTITINTKIHIHRGNVYFINNGSLWELNGRTKVLEKTLDFPEKFNLFEFYGGNLYACHYVMHVISLPDTSPLLKYNLEDHSKTDTLAESHYYIEKGVDRSLLIQHLGPSGADSRLVLVDEHDDEFQTRINTREILYITLKDKDILMLNGAGGSYLWNLKTGKIRMNGKTPSGKVHIVNDSTSYATRFFYLASAESDSIRVTKQVNNESTLIFSGSVGGLVQKTLSQSFEHYSDYLELKDKFYFISTKGNSQNRDIRLSCLDGVTKEISHRSFPDRFKEAFSGSGRYSFEIQHDTIFIFPVSNSKEVTFYDTRSGTFGDSLFVENYKWRFTRLNHTTLIAETTDSLKIYNRVLNKSKSIRKNFSREGSAILQAQIYRECVFLVNETEFALFDGEKLRHIGLPAGIPHTRNQSITYTSQTVHGTVIISMKAMQGNGERRYYLLDIHTGRLAFPDKFSPGEINLRDTSLVKALSGNKIYLAKECGTFYILDKETLEVSEFSGSCNFRLGHILTSGRILFTEGRKVYYSDYPYKKIETLTSDGFIIKAAFNQAVYSDNKTIRLLSGNTELARVSEEGYQRTTDLSGREVLYRLSGTHYLYVDLLTGRSVKLSGDRDFDRGVTYRGLVYLTALTNRELWVLDGNSLKVSLKNISGDFLKSKNGEFLYFVDNLDHTRRRWMQAEAGQLKELFVSDNYNPVFQDVSDPGKIHYFDPERNTLYTLPGIPDGAPVNARLTTVIHDVENRVLFRDDISMISFDKKTNRVERLPDAYGAIQNGTWFNDLWYFSAKDKDLGSEIWESDGSSEGTRMAYDINKGPNGSSPGKPFILKNNLYVFAHTSQSGLQLWHLAHSVREPENVLLPSENLPLHFSFYPNPTADYLNISSTTKSPEKYKITVFSTDGKMLSEKESLLPQKLDLSGLESGIYLLNVRSGQVQKTFRVFKN